MKHNLSNSVNPPIMDENFTPAKTALPAHLAKRLEQKEKYPYLCLNSRPSSEEIEKKLAEAENRRKVAKYR